MAGQWRQMMHAVVGQAKKIISMLSADATGTWFQHNDRTDAYTATHGQGRAARPAEDQVERR